MPTTPSITSITFANRPCWLLRAPQGQAIVAEHGGQVLSWVPLGGHEVLWLSAQALPPPAATRGGIPVCWPWFGKQGMPDEGMQHGPVRNRPWQLVGAPHISANGIVLELQPAPATQAGDAMTRFAHGLALRLRITLDDGLTLALTTHNTRSTPFPLTQALHTYLAVGDVRQVGIAALAQRPYHDKLTDATNQTHAHPWRYKGACDRIYSNAGGGDATTTYAVADPALQRHIHLQTQGSRSVVLWNPGPEGARTLADMPDDAWNAFVCLETSNAGADTVTLSPGASHTLVQRLQTTSANSGNRPA